MNNGSQTAGLGKVCAIVSCLACAAVAALAHSAFAGGYSNPAIGHVKPMNLFEAGSDVSFTVKPGVDADKGFLVTNYYGEVVSSAYDRDAGRLNLGKLPVGYYAIENGGKTTSFGVVPFQDRSAAVFRGEGRRFGLKVFTLGHPGVWWRRPWTWELDECVDACERLGLQWTRHAFNGREVPGDPGILSTLQLVSNHMMNCVMKIEGFPKSAYDEGRYGPMDRFRETRNRRGWQRCSVPLREPYQSWLAGEVAKLPEGQNVFEIGNEVWDLMTAEEFAELCRMTVPVVRDIRPGCSIGADPGALQWGTAFAKAGGFDGMDAMYIHPYSFTPQPELRIRAWLRNSREYFGELAGRGLDVYVTEYGWPTAPCDRRGHSVDERRQAQRTVRESLMLYAEGCKTLIPHMMADREQDPAEREHWFGFFRLAGEPKPVVIAHAACARMIDGSDFVGDVFLPGAETGVGAMLFKDADGWVLALWTQDEAPGTGREVTVPARPDDVYGIMGERRRFTPDGGGLTLKISADVTYLAGRGAIPDSLLKLVDKSGELSETQWFERVDCGTPPFTVTTDEKPVALLNGPDGEHPTFAAWHDDKEFHLRLCVPATCAPCTGGNLYCHFSTRPDRQVELKDWGIFDYELKVSVTNGAFAVSLWNPVYGKRPHDIGADGSTRGIAWTGTSKDGALDFAITFPKTALRGFGSNRRGLMAGQVNWVAEGKSWNLASRNGERNWQWPLWKVEQGDFADGREGNK